MVISIYKQRGGRAEIHSESILVLSLLPKSVADGALKNAARLGLMKSGFEPFFHRTLGTITPINFPSENSRLTRFALVPSQRAGRVLMSSPEPGDGFEPRVISSPPIPAVPSENSTGLDARLASAQSSILNSTIQPASGTGDLSEILENGGRGPAGEKVVILRFAETDRSFASNQEAKKRRLSQ